MKRLLNNVIVRKIAIFLVLVSLCFVGLVGCASKYPEVTEPVSPAELNPVSPRQLVEVKYDYVQLEGKFENDSYIITVTSDGTNSDSHFVVGIKNKTNDIISIDGNKIVYSNGVLSSRLVDGRTRKINSNLAQADLVIAPNSITTVELFSADYLISTDYEGYLYFIVNDGTSTKTIGVDLKKGEVIEKSSTEVR